MKLHAVRVALATVLVLTAGLLFAGSAGALSTGNGGWQWQNPLPHGAAYNGMHFITPQRGWLVTETCILKTTDGGATVTVQSNHNVRFKDITFVGAKRGWAVGWPLRPSKGRVVIYRTTNGGTLWTRVPVNVRGWLSAVCFVNKKVGWAVGGKAKGGAGLVLKTVNGGVTWRQQSASRGAELNDVSMISATRGWAVAAMGKVWRTKNGATWHRVGPELDESPCAVRFQSAQTGWVAAWGKVWRTNNGGVSWTTQLDLGLSNSELDAMDFADAQHGWVVGPEGLTYGTTDGGAHWTSQGTPGRPWLASVDAVSADAVVVAGDGGLIGHSGNGGATWAWLPTAASGYLGSFNAVDFTDANNGWIAADQQDPSGPTTNTGIFHTLDGGATWTRQDSSVMASLHDIDMISATSGWAVGDAGAIVHTTDGSSWAVQASGTTADLMAVSFLDASNGWAVGSDYDESTYTGGGIVRHTTDGGQHWVAQTSPALDYGGLYDVKFADALHGWAVGRNAGEGDGEPAVIVRTADGGATWTQQLSYIPEVSHSFGTASFSSIAVIDADHAVAVGGSDNADVERPIIFRTTNGGSKWTKIAGPKRVDNGVGLTDVFFLNATRGWAAASNGTVLRTTDGGLTWTKQRSGADWISGLCFANATTGWLVGWSADILKTTTGGLAP